MKPLDPGQGAFMTQAQKDQFYGTGAVAPVAGQNQTAFQMANNLPPATNSTTPPAPIAPPVSTPAPMATATPAPSVTINNNPPVNASQTAKNAPASESIAKSAPVATQSNQGTLLPFNGSVVDLLNSAGMASDKGSRQKLAGELGVQNYDFSAAKNTELAQKFREFYASKQGTTAPQTGAEARDVIQQGVQDLDQGPSGAETQEQFMQDYFKMNPVVKMLYDQIAQIDSASNKRVSFVDEYNKLRETSGIEGLQTDLMNINNIMEGTEDDIRDEITKAGGFATESQVQALKNARNKTFIKQAQSLQEQIALKEDYIDRVIQLTGADRDQVEKDVDRKLGLTEKLLTVTQQMDNAAAENFNSIIKEVGYDGFVATLGGDQNQLKQAARVLGMSPSQLNKLASQPKPKDLQFISGTENQRAGYFDKTTGIFTPIGGTGGGGTGGVSSSASSGVTRDADAVMAGVLNLQDISTKDNYRASVAAELKNRFTQAQQSGDVYGLMAASAAYDKEPSDTFLTSMEKTLSVLDQIGVLQENIIGTKTGPIVGAFRGANPWDTNAQTIKAQLNAIVPNLARGVYGEVGVLTDNDIKTYAKTIPNIKSTEDVRNAILYITVDMIKRNVETKIENQAAGQRDMSGYADTYSSLADTADNILKTLPGSAKPGSQNSVRMQGPGGMFDVPKDQVSNFKQNGYREI